MNNSKSRNNSGYRRAKPLSKPLYWINRPIWGLLINGFCTIFLLFLFDFNESIESIEVIEIIEVSSIKEAPSSYWGLHRSLRTDSRGFVVLWKEIIRVLSHFMESNSKGFIVLCELILNALSFLLNWFQRLYRSLECNTKGFSILCEIILRSGVMSIALTYLRSGVMSIALTYLRSA